MENIRLTQTVQKGGCAAKIEAAELRKILAQVRFPPSHAEVLIDGRHFDDAAIYQINSSTALVQTIDFFTPILDTPYTFGKVAACNAVSDVYAMGGKPVTALAVLAFPIATLENSIMAEILQGASDLLSEAQCTLVGGHSIDDDTLKFGLSVTGLISPLKIWTNQGAREGDTLILTKPLGTGTLTAALKRGLVTENEILQATESMVRLNNILDFLSEELASAVHAATDITGFGLSGHGYQMAKASNKTFAIKFNSLPLFDRTREFIEKEVLTKAHRTNRNYTNAEIDCETLSYWQQLLLHDPQTSGGLLLSVAPQSADQIVSVLSNHFPKVRQVGEVMAPQNKRLVFNL